MRVVEMDIEKTAKDEIQALKRGAYNRGYNDGYKQGRKDAQDEINRLREYIARQSEEEYE